MYKPQKIKLPDLPKSEYLYFKRNSCLLIHYLFGDVFTKMFWKYFNTGLTTYIALKAQAGYMSTSEITSFSEGVCSLLVSEDKYALKVSKKLVHSGKRIMDKINLIENPRQLYQGAEKLFKSIKVFMIYHTAVRFGTEILESKYLSTNPDPSLLIKYQHLLQAKKDTDHILPYLENYFKKCGVQDCLPEEVISMNTDVVNKPIPKSVRNLIFISGKRYVLPSSTTKVIRSKVESLTNKNGLKSVVIKGKSVYRGLVSGKAKLVLDFDNITEICDRDIVVTPCIRPQHYPIFSKALAIVTDEGGTLSHAAILAREKGIPCIVGTKISTKIIKEGGIIDVDANVGEVRIK